MKLAFSTLGCPNWSMEQIIDNAKSMGFQGIELRGIGNTLNADEIPELSQANRKNTLERLREQGLSICSLNCSASFDSPAAISSALLETSSAVKICGDMQIPYIRVFGNQVAAGESEEAACQRVASGICRVCDLAADFGVSVLLEVHGDYNTESRLKRIEELVSRQNFGLIWDIAHTAVTFKNQSERFIDRFFPLIRHLHIKDAVFKESGQSQLCLTGEGEIPIAEIIRRLEKEKYNGFYSFEWEKRWVSTLPEPEEAFPHFIKFMKSL